MTTVPPIDIDHEEIVVRRGRRSGVHIVIAVHSTALGPALGGARLWHYPSPTDGFNDACRLSRAMSLKAAVAGLELGGGKAVLCAPAGPPAGGYRRHALLLDFGDAIESLDGRYTTAEDVGTGPGDMAVIAERTDHVVGRSPEEGGSGDPSPYTARGVLAALRAAVEARGAQLEGLEVCVIGLGHVGAHLATQLRREGARLIVSDIDATKRRLAEALGARWAEPGSAITTNCDVLAPCALGGAIDALNAGSIRAAIVCGAANNVLADESVAELLDRRGIVYIPDFLANAGGLISVYRELAGFDEGHALELVDGIGAKVTSVLADAAANRRTVLASALELAQSRLDSAELVSSRNGLSAAGGAA